MFLKTLGESCARSGWRVHAWVLMSNHYHLLIETVEPTLVGGCNGCKTPTRAVSTRGTGCGGRLFGDRYKAVLVEGATGYYYETLLDYIHLNPVRAKLVRLRRGQSVLDYKWSSVAGGHALPAGKRAKWLAAEEALAAFGCKDNASGRQRRGCLRIHTWRLIDCTQYQKFDSAERTMAHEVIAEWALSDDEALRFDALALIDEFKIANEIPVLQKLARRLALSSAPRAPYELKKVNRILKDLRVGG